MIHKYPRCFAPRRHCRGFVDRPTYLMDVARIAARLLVSAPEKRCGKTRLVEVADLLVRQVDVGLPMPPPHRCSGSIEAWSPTLLIDEFDSFGKDDNDLRNIVNSGHSRAAAFVLRTEGDAHEPKTIFDVGVDPDRHDRAAERHDPRSLDHRHACNARRAAKRLPSLRHGQDAEAFKVLRQKIARFALDHNAAPEAGPARGAPTRSPTGEQDNWELAFAIADAAGGDWPKRARDAAIFLARTAARRRQHSERNCSIDVRTAFCCADTDRLTSAELIEALTADETSPWNAYPRDKPISQPQLARMLRRFDVIPSTIRDRGRTRQGIQAWRGRQAPGPGRARHLSIRRCLHPATFPRVQA